MANVPHSLLPTPYSLLVRAIRRQLSARSRKNCRFPMGYPSRSNENQRAFTEGEWTMLQKGAPIADPKGKLGVLLVGMGAVTTTFIAGVEAIRKGIARPIGSLTQMGTVRLGKRTEGRSPLIKDFVPLAELDDLVFGAW